VTAFPLFCWIVLACFLACLGLFALAVTRVVAPGGQGHTRGLLGGLGSLFALVFLGGLGLAGLAASVVALGVGTLVESNPVRRIEIQRAQPGASAPEAPEGVSRHSREGALEARVTVDEGAGQKLIGLLRDTVGVDLEHLGVHRQESADGAVEVYEFRLPVSDRDLEHLERDLRRELDGQARLPRSFAVELDSAGRRHR